jgi:hypothetical protein
MRNNSKVFFGFSLITIFFFVFLRIKGHQEDVNYQFNGRIDSVSYDIKGSPTILVNGRSYYLSGNDWLFRAPLEKGDSIMKKSKLMTIKVTRHSTGETLTIKESVSAFR